MVAFNFARQSNHPTFIRMMSYTYELPIAKDMFIDKIREIIKEHNYKDVMKMHKLFAVNGCLHELQSKLNDDFYFLGMSNCTRLGIA